MYHARLKRLSFLVVVSRDLYYKRTNLAVSLVKVYRKQYTIENRDVGRPRLFEQRLVQGFLHRAQEPA